MSLPPLNVLYEDNHLLAVLKPAMIPTMGVAAGEPSLLAMARQYVRRKYRKPGAVYLGIVSRLDTPVTGVVLIARTSKAAARLTSAFASRNVQKQYWAVVEGEIEPPAGQCENWLRKDERHRLVHVSTARANGAQLARLSYRRVKSLAGSSLVEVELETGRKHQIRVQLARLGFPILGDEKYGARRGFSTGIALHARRLALTHPVRGTPLEIVAPLPGAWRALGIRDESTIYFEPSPTGGTIIGSDSPAGYQQQAEQDDSGRFTARAPRGGPPPSRPAGPKKQASRIKRSRRGADKKAPTGKKTRRGGNRSSPRN